MQFSKPEGLKSIQVDLSGNYIVMMRLLRFYLLFAFLGGMLALRMLFAEPSMDGSMFLMGFSALRVAWGGIILVLVSALVWANIKAWRDERWIGSILARFETSLGRPEVLLPLVVWSAVLLLAGGLLLYLPVSPLAPCWGCFWWW